MTFAYAAEAQTSRQPLGRDGAARDASRPLPATDAAGQPSLAHPSPPGAWSVTHGTPVHGTMAGPRI